jgi:hypothetical protein
MHNTTNKLMLPQQTGSIGPSCFPPFWAQVAGRAASLYSFEEGLNEILPSEAIKSCSCPNYLILMTRSIAKKEHQIKRKVKSINHLHSAYLCPPKGDSGCFDLKLFEKLRFRSFQPGTIWGSGHALRHVQKLNEKYMEPVL